MTMLREPEVILHAVPIESVLKSAFNTVPLIATDWVIAAGLALTVSPVLELAKWMERRGWFGVLD